MKKIKEEMLGILWAILIVAALLTPFWTRYYFKLQSLKENGEYTNAVIYKLYSAKRKQTTKLYYYYFVNDTIYTGSGKWSPRTDAFSIGDTIAVIYDKKKPAFSETKDDIDKPFFRKAAH